MTEFLRDDLRRTRVGIEVRLLAGNFEMSAARKVADNILFPHNLLDQINRGKRIRVHATGQIHTIALGQSPDIELHSSEHHTAVTGAGAPPNAVSVKHGNLGAVLGEYSGRG